MDPFTILALGGAILGGLKGIAGLRQRNSPMGRYQAGGPPQTGDYLNALGSFVPLAGPVGSFFGGGPSGANPGGHWGEAVAQQQLGRAVPHQALQSQITQSLMQGGVPLSPNDYWTRRMLLRSQGGG
jgi:hypothetical protein